MSWNYRIVKKTRNYNNGENEYQESLYEIREVYYNNDGSIYAITENPVSIISEEGTEGIAQVLELMKLATQKDIIDEDTLVFSDFSDGKFIV